MSAFTLQVPDINEALPLALPLLRDHGRPFTASSLANARPTMEWPGVFITEYTRPMRNVLFDPVRDANPFFHYLEAMWILAGRRDVAFLSWVLPGMARYSDGSTNFHASYGYRLRKQQGFDQVAQALAVLEKRPASRQVVMQIWDADLDLSGNSTDIPCNDLVMCKIRDGKLNITVANRSNDAIWGAYGANAVQFSMLQMYMAASLKVGVGVYTQVSDSMHVYEDTPYWQLFKQGKTPTLEDGPSAYEGMPYMNMFEFGIDHFDTELPKFFKQADKAIAKPFDVTDDYGSQVVADAARILNSLRAHKNKRYEDAAMWAGKIVAPDWHLACMAWLNRRVQNANAA